MKEIEEVISKYFDALYFGDEAVFRTVFHSKAALYTATGGTLVQLDLDGYVAIVKGRQAPSERGDQRRDSIISISIGSPTTAHARVRDQYLPKQFIDDLTLVRVDGRWQIIAKVWHFDI
jgi:hypothetical protein